MSHARHLFKDNIAGFQGLRELSYRPEWRVGFITASRRSIRDIEMQTKAISTFDGIFHKHYLAMFNSEDLDEYFKRFLSVEISLTLEAKDRITFYCGGHPYLLEMLGYEIVEIFRKEQNTDIEKAAQRTLQSFLDQYDRMASLLKEDNALDKLIQILFGPVIDVKQSDADEFLKYGIIKYLPENYEMYGLKEPQDYVAYSPHFHFFLNTVGRDIDLWTVWKDTEKLLRHLVTTVMMNKYGENWIELRENKFPGFKIIFDKCRQSQLREQKSFGSRASNSLIDFTYPDELFQIIFTEWEDFKNYFQGISG